MVLVAWVALGVEAAVLLAMRFYLGGKLDAHIARTKAQISEVPQAPSPAVRIDALAVRIDAVTARLDDHIRRHTG